MNRKSFLSSIVIIAMLIATLSMLVTANAEVGRHAAEVPAGYIAINNKNDMLELMNYGLENAGAKLTNNYILMSDIEFESADFEASGDFYNNGKAWVPLGNKTNPYAGIFDGNGYTISGLVVLDNVDNYDVEVFGSFIGVNDGTVKNLHMKDTTLDAITGGEPNRILANVYSGVVGINLENGIVSNCSFVSSKAGAVSQTVNAYAGGIVGYNSGTINNCYVTGSEIKATTASSRTDRTDKAIAGGICGYNLDNATIWNVMVTNDVEVKVTTSIEREGNAGSGSIVGANNVLAKIMGAYYPDNTEFVGTGSVARAVGIPLTVEQYKVADYFGSFDFANVWEMGVEYPKLRINGVVENVVPNVTPKVELPSTTPTPEATLTPETTLKPTSSPTMEVTPKPTTPVEEFAIKFVKSKITLKKGKKKILKVKITGAKKAKFSTNKKKVVKIIMKKPLKVKVKGMKKGKAVITAKAVGKKAKCKVTVK